MHNDEIYHFGVKGMKWGVRRYQNADGTLTAAGKKRISKQYSKTAEKTVRDLSKSATRRYIESHNRAADYMNREGNDKFNSQQEKKYGKKYTERESYFDDYQKAFDEVFTKYYDQSLSNFYKTNKNYKKGKELVDKYEMKSWDELAKNNEKTIDELRAIVAEYERK